MTCRFDSGKTGTLANQTLSQINTENNVQRERARKHKHNTTSKLVNNSALQPFFKADEVNRAAVKTDGSVNILLLQQRKHEQVTSEKRTLIVRRESE